jgi:hypothetical protein
MTHSEGPYTIDSGANGAFVRIVDKEGVRIADINTFRNAEGNAHLLAASWQMKQALERVAFQGRHATSCGGNGLHGRLKTLRCDCVMKDVLRAISSAKGEGV